MRQWLLPSRKGGILRCLSRQARSKREGDNPSADIYQTQSGEEDMEKELTLTHYEAKVLRDYIMRLEEAANPNGSPAVDLATHCVLTRLGVPFWKKVSTGETYLDAVGTK